MPPLLIFVLFVAGLWALAYAIRRRWVSWTMLLYGFLGLGFMFGLSVAIGQMVWSGGGSTDFWLMMGVIAAMVAILVVATLLAGNRSLGTLKVLDPFNPPSEVADPFSAVHRGGGLLTRIGWNVWLPLGFVSAGIGWIAGLVIENYKRVYVRPGQQWYERVRDDRNATAFDRLRYLGGHPLLPMPEEVALFVCPDGLHMELRGGKQADIEWQSVQSVEAVPRHEFQTVLFPGESLWKPIEPEVWATTEYALAVDFIDDRGFSNRLVFVGGVLGTQILANTIQSARYHAG